MKLARWALLLLPFLYHVPIMPVYIHLPTWFHTSPLGQQVYDVVQIRYVHHVLHDDILLHRDNNIQLSFLFVVSF
ncbi:hypothetical protein PAPYR_10797 [Paratrimastix pyriformis]|uniref:Secreted protein n=1 Tax=Paratrimastix pyriformis TaxID=342808 RepID=A0ABQ8UAW1_9EUKA|nr:hypothetical protein PAPYR_10797 [Paratrimastix pyriformis]